MGNLSSQRDWGHAKDYVRAMHLILQQDEADDYVIATGITTSIRDFIRMAGEEIGLEIAFKGEGAEERGTLVSVDEALYADKVGPMNAGLQGRIGREIVRVDPKYFRPTEVDLLIGDPTKSMTKLGWQPEYDLKGLIKDMMQSDVKLFKQDEYLKNGGFRTMNYFE